MGRRGADLLVDQLVAEGIDTIFGLPGIQIMAAYDALHARRDRIRTITTRHEQSCAYLAYGYAKASGRAGTMLLVPGPGLLNAAAGIALGYAADAPMVGICGQIPRDAIGRGQGHLHEIDDQLECVRPITRWTGRALTAAEIPAAVHRAVLEATTPRTRPTVVDLPPEALREESTAELVAAEEAPRPGADAALVARAAAIVRAGERICLIVGGGAMASDAAAEVAELADRCDAPVVTTQNAKGIVDERLERAVGVTYFAGLGPGHRILPRSDVVIAIGTRLHIRGLPAGLAARIIHIDADPGAIGRNLPTEVGLVGDARACLRQLLVELGDWRRPAGARAEEIRGYRDRFADQVRTLSPAASQLAGAIRAALPDDGILVSGMNWLGYWSHLAFPAAAPRTYLTPGFFGALGYAFPTALGAKVACPRRPVVAVCGDGGFLFAAEELATAVQEGIAVVVLLLDNGSFGASEHDQRALYGDRILGTRLHNPDFLALARAFGVEAARTEASELEGALRWAIALDRPVLLECKVGVDTAPFQLGALPPP